MQKGHRTLGRVVKSKKIIFNASKRIASKELEETSTIKEEVKEESFSNELMISIISIVLYVLIEHFL